MFVAACLPSVTSFWSSKGSLYFSVGVVCRDRQECFISMPFPVTWSDWQAEGSQGQLRQRMESLCLKGKLRQTARRKKRCGNKEQRCGESEQDGQRLRRPKKRGKFVMPVRLMTRLWSLHFKNSDAKPWADMGALDVLWGVFTFLLQSSLQTANGLRSGFITKTVRRISSCHDGL